MVNNVGPADEQATQFVRLRELTVNAIQSNHVLLSPEPVANFTMSVVLVSFVVNTY